jgi:hypothetical protein
MGYGIYACVDSTWWIYKYDAAGTPHLVKNGTLPSSDTYDVAFTVSGSTLQAVIGGQTVSSISMDSDYVSTDSIPLATYSDAVGGSATISDFVYAPSP